MNIEDIKKIAIATKQFLKLVEETKEPMYQGYYFIDYTLLCVHCEGFSKLTIEESIELIKTLGFTVLMPEQINEREIIEPIFSLNSCWDEESLKVEIEKFIKEEC